MPKSPRKFHSPHSGLFDIVSVRLTAEDIAAVNRIIDNDSFGRTASQIIRDAIQQYAKALDKAK